MIRFFLKKYNSSIHENGIYDLPAILTYVRNNTKKEISVIGHSSSTTASLIYASLKPLEANKTVNAFIAMSPLAYTANITSPIKYLSFYILPFYEVKKNLRKSISYILIFLVVTKKCWRIFVWEWNVNYSVSNSAIFSIQSFYYNIYMHTLWMDTFRNGACKYISEYIMEKFNFLWLNFRT